MRKQLFLVVSFLLFSFYTTAQDRWAVEIRPQVNFPIQQPDLFDLETGYGFEALLSYKFIPQLGAYAGWGWNSFGIDGEIEGANFEIDETGYSFGLRFNNSLSNSLSYLIGVGGIYKHLESEDSTGDISGDAAHDLGWEVQGGLIFLPGGGFEITPQVIYRSLTATAEFGSLVTGLDLQYISFAISFAKRF